MSKETDLEQIEHEWHGTLGHYLIGLALSLFLTFASYWIVSGKFVEQNYLFYALFALALLQMGAQLLFFLHVGKGTKPRWDLLVILFAFLTLVVIVGGTLWIMYSLNERGMDFMKM